MHLDSYETKDGGGSFQGQTPLGPVRVVWQRKWQTLIQDEQGRPIGSEFNTFLFYTLTIDSPQTLPIHLETQQYDLYTMRLNDHLIPLGPYLSGEVDVHGPYDARHLSYPFPGGHNVLILRMGMFTSE